MQRSQNAKKTVIYKRYSFDAFRNPEQKHTKKSLQEQKHTIFNNTRNLLPLYQSP